MSQVIYDRPPGLDGGAPPLRQRTRLVEIVIPVYNEQLVLADSVDRLHAYLAENLPYPFRITIADNASTDETWAVALDLSERYPHVDAVHLDQKGRGRALRTVWEASDAEVVAYMDVDLSTGLDAFLPLIAPLMSGHSDLAIGSRLARGAAVVRGPKREFISRTYNLMLRSAMTARFSDAQCGFKAGRTETIKALLPQVQDQAWFFDTELLLLAERSGLRIHEVPVDWVDDPDSRVDIRSTALADLRGVARLAKAFATGQLPITALRKEFGRTPGTLAGQAVRFVVIGLASTVAYLVLFLLLRPALPAQAANLVALLATAVANTAANRRLTFGVRGGRDVARHQVQGLVVFAIGLAFTSGALALVGSAGRWVEVAVLVVANLLATVVRFVLLRSWVFRTSAVGSKGV